MKFRIKEEIKYNGTRSYTPQRKAGIIPFFGGWRSFFSIPYNDLVKYDNIEEAQRYLDIVIGKSTKKVVVHNR